MQSNPNKKSSNEFDHFSKIYLYTSNNVVSIKIFLFVSSARGNLSIWWTLVNLNKDIAGFYVVIRNGKNEILVEHHIPYENRIDKIEGKNVCQNNCQNLELCVMSKDSRGSINEWFDSQCIYLPDDLKDIQEKYTVNYDRIQVIHSLRKHIRAHNGWNTSEACSSFLNYNLFRNLVSYIVVLQIVKFSILV